mgnify:FL=1
MNSYFHVYSRQRCNFCSEAKKILKDSGDEFMVTDMTKAKSALEVLKGWTSWDTVPIVFHIQGDKQFFVGGCEELKEYLERDNNEEAEGN